MRLKAVASQDLLALMSKILTQGYLLSNRVIKETKFLDWEMGQELRPHLRRVVIDYLARSMAPSVPGLVASLQPNQIANCRHVELAFGDQLIFTINHVTTSNGLPRNAVFRSVLSENNDQATFMDQLYVDATDGLPINQKIFSMLIHEGTAIPESAALVIPTSDNRNILDKLLINLRMNGKREVEEIQDFDLGPLLDELREDGPV